MEMQKILYIAHMVYMGENDGEPLVHGYFEAWEYGPVHPELYHYIKLFGAGPVTNEYGHFDFVDHLPKGPERRKLDRACKFFPHGSGPKLVHITHWPKGAWSKCHTGERFIRITDDAIIGEFRARLKDMKTRKKKKRAGGREREH